MRDEVRWERMFPDEIERAFARCSVVDFSYGLCEPHGPQSDLGCDSVRAHRVCVLAAHRHGGMVAPVNYWHVHDIGRYAAWGHEYVGQVDRSWLTPLPPWMFFKNFCYHVRTADRPGFEAALFFSGHGGLHTADWQRVVELIQSHIGTRLEAVENDEDLKGTPLEDWTDHAGCAETGMRAVLRGHVACTWSR